MSLSKSALIEYRRGVFTGYTSCSGEQPCSLRVDAELVLKCVCGLPFVYMFACALAGLPTVALQQNVCPFLSPLM